MSVVVQFADFTASGALGSAWTQTGGTFVQDGQRAVPTVATYTRAVLTTTPPLSASTPIRGRYEADFLLPAAFPTTGLVRGGVVFAGGYGHLIWERTSGGAATRFDFFGRTAAGVETSFYSLTVAIAAGSVVRVRADVSYNAANLVVDAWYSLDGGATFSYLFTSTPSTAVWNTATGQALATITASARTGGIVANTTAGGYLDNFRVTDIGTLAITPTIDSAPTLTAFPTLTPFAMSEEDDAGSETLTVQPSYAMQVEDGWEITEHPYDGGYVGTVARQTVRRRRWTFHWDALDAADTIAVGGLRTAVYATKAAFNWTDPTTGEALRVRFETPPEFSLVAPLTWQASALVREVLADA